MKIVACEILPIDNYNFTPDDELLLDTNIWLYIYGPQKPRDARVAAYSQALTKILTAQCRIYIDVLIVSEFINTYARLKWDVMGKPHGKFKLFRKSPDFKPLAQDIAADIKRVLSHCIRIESRFDTLDINELIVEYAAGDADFNDQIIVAMCKERRLKLLTHDSDFCSQGIPVVTANKRLLSS